MALYGHGGVARVVSVLLDVEFNQWCLFSPPCFCREAEQGHHVAERKDTLTERVLRKVTTRHSLDQCASS